MLILTSLRVIKCSKRDLYLEQKSIRLAYHVRTSWNDVLLSSRGCRKSGREDTTPFDNVEVTLVTESRYDMTAVTTMTLRWQEMPIKRRHTTGNSIARQFLNDDHLAGQPTNVLSIETTTTLHTKRIWHRKSTRPELSAQYTAERRITPGKSSVAWWRTKSVSGPRY